jgi:hypothetical protein
MERVQVQEWQPEAVTSHQIKMREREEMKKKEE